MSVEDLLLKMQAFREQCLFKHFQVSAWPRNFVTVQQNAGKCGIDNNNFMDNKSSEARETMMANLVSAKDKLDEIAQKTLKLVQENKKVT
ncbi:hypothetical protein Pint_34009 [Pistacia integerrima]|uniref:Uncharacterized protein n=1 Tax=Pistacia integerrima TaxID=434235 RepID=A0ACC0X8I3_9ROSI|nr:hypothetical protein Pint_34009 [Pistacia integerrima]